MKRLKYVVSALAAAALGTSVMTNALASHPAPLHNDARAARKTVLNAAVTVTGVFHANKNESVYGKLYAHGGEQVQKSLLVRNGGLSVSGGTKSDTLQVSGLSTLGGGLAVTGGAKADSLEVAGPLSAASATVSGNLQAGDLISTGAISGSTTITTGGKITGNGVDAGAGGLTTTGAITAGGGLTVTGPVDFSHATVTGFNLSTQLQNLTLSTLTLGGPNGTVAPLALTENGQTEQLGVDNTGALTVRSEVVQSNFSAGAATLGSLTLGTAAGTAAALTLTGNNKTSQIGVDANGNLTVGGIVSSGNLNVAGSATVGSLVLTGTQGLVSGTLQAPPTSSTNSAPGALAITGSTIALNGATTVNSGLTVAGGNDLTLSTSGGSNPTSSHIVANQARDIAGQTTIAFSGTYGPGTKGSATVTFTRAYNTMPIITITPATDPAPGSNSEPKAFVTLNSGANNTYTGFTITYTAPNDAAPTGTANPSVIYDYHVIGS